MCAPRELEKLRASDLGKAFQAKQSDSVSVAATNGVLRLGFFMAEHHLPLSTTDHLVKVVAAVCPDSKIAAVMKGARNRTKMTAAVRTVAADMHAELDSYEDWFFHDHPG